MSEIIWSDDAWEDYLYWQTQDKVSPPRIRRGFLNVKNNSEIVTALDDERLALAVNIH